MATHLHDNVARVYERMNEALHRAGRKENEVTLIAVTKGVPAHIVDQAITLGIDHIGENRVQEAEKKFPLFKQACTHHFIGTLQRNKAGKAVQLFQCIHSVDRISLVRALSRRIGEDMRDVFLQVNVSGEETKHGVTPSELEPLAEAASEAGNIRVVGLMTMAPYSDDPERARPHFARLRELNESLRHLNLPRVTATCLSMGMSNDFEVAIEEGATHVRVGSAIFVP